MDSFIGAPGMLVPFNSPTGLTPSPAPRSIVKRTMQGIVKEQRLPRGRREWSVDIGTATPTELAGLCALVDGFFGPPPWMWVDSWAQVTNLLSPEASLMSAGTYVGSVGAVSAGGGGAASDGALFGRSVSVSDGVLLLGYRDGFSDRFPVVPGLPTTGSFYASGLGRARLDFHDVAGGLLATEYGANEGGSMTRRSVSVPVVPEGAVTGQLRIAGHTRVTMPAVTWTKTVMPWSIGKGCNRVTIDGLLEAVQFAVPDEPNMQSSSASFIVKELG